MVCKVLAVGSRPRLGIARRQRDTAEIMEQGAFENWINDLPISPALGELLRFGAAMHIDRPKRSTAITSTSLLFALLESQADFAPSSLVSDPFCLAFSQAAQHLGRETYQDVWSDYLKDMASFGQTLPEKLPHPSANVEKLVKTSWLVAQSNGARYVDIEHVIDTIFKLRTGRLVARLKRSTIKIADLEKEYRERIDSALAVQPTQIIDTGLHPLSTGIPPIWASGWGQDQYGLFTELSVGEVMQRLRWITPGRFTMGSPEDEPERWDDEDPQTEITFLQGYWLFDTAITQGLWSAVMGNNPSEFRGDDLPVERVNFDDASAFIDQLNALFTGLDLRLPSEAQWEYACRAGEITAYHFGNEARPNQIHFDGEATIPVKAKPPNAWGLYQMHGNVLEWCADIWHDSHEGADPNGAPREGDSQSGEQPHVIRGGSWDDDARSVRAAFRFGDVPGIAYYNLGFRCAAGQSGPEALSVAFGPDGREAEPRLADPKASARKRAREG